MRISVFITSYNQKEYLVEAIDSVLAQTLKPEQIIIVDDCSTDGSREVIEGYKGRFSALVSSIYHDRNTGVTQTRIDALKAVTGDYVTYVDGDDRFLPSKLEKEAKVLVDNPGTDISFSNNFYMTTEGEHTGTWVEGARPPVGNVFKETFSRAFPRKSLFRMELVNYEAWKKIGFHDTGLGIYEDFDMRIRLTKNLRVVYYDEPLSEIRLHGKGLSSSKAVRHVEALEFIYKKNESLLNDLSAADRKFVREGFFDFIAIAERMAVKELLMENRRIEAARHLLMAIRHDASLSDLGLGARILFPGTLRRQTH